MTYQYKCDKCNLTTDYSCGYGEEKPEKLKCICGGVLTYDWGQFSVSSVLIPERHKA